MPWRAMQKQIVKNGCMFSCAWFPPLFTTEEAPKATRFTGGVYPFVTVASLAPAGTFTAAGSLVTCAECV